MLDSFLAMINSWLEINPIFAVFICLLWGICSVVLSPCQLATVSLLSAPSVASSAVPYKILKFTLGHVLALFIVGIVFTTFSYQFDFLGHYWTVPFGMLFIYMAWQLWQKEHCDHCSPHGESHGIMDKFLKYSAKNSFGFFGMGLGYGLLSSACVLVFLSPILLLALNQSYNILLGFNLAFAIGHSLPIILVGLLAKSIHKIMCSTTALMLWPRRMMAVVFVLIGLVLVAHPFLELMGFDFHGHGHEHNNELHQHPEHAHDCDGHSHDSHNHDNHDHEHKE